MTTEQDEQMQSDYGKQPLCRAVYDYYFQLVNVVRSFPPDAQYALGEDILSYGLRLNIVIYRMMQAQKNGFQDLMTMSMKQADETIENLRFLIRISYDMKLFNIDRFTTLSEDFESMRKQLHEWYEEQKFEEMVDG